MRVINTAAGGALVALGLALAAGSAFGHGDVQPQPVKTDGLKPLGAEWVTENPYKGDAHAISIGARPQRECPGMLWNVVCWPAKIGTLRSMWQAPQVLPGTPPPSAPRVTGGEWGCMSLPWVGRSLAG